MTNPNPGGITTHNLQQRGYFERGIKQTMVPRHSRYLERHVDEVLRRGGIRPGARVLEVGCGMGRYTLLLAERGIAVEGLDLTPYLLEQLRAYNAGRYDIPLHAADIIDFPNGREGSYDAVIGFFALHHMHDLPACYAAMARLVRPGGPVVFLEPNPYNPSYYVQIAITPTTTWAGEKGILKMRRSSIFPAMTAAGLVEPAIERFGLLPPALVNRRGGRAIEAAGEAALGWTPCLAFQVFKAIRPSAVG